MKTRGLVLDSRRYRGTVTPPDSLEDTSRFGNDGVISNGTWVRLSSGLWVQSFTAAPFSIVDIPYDASIALDDNFTYLGWFKFPTGAPATRGALFNSHSAGYAGGWSLEYGFGGGENLAYIDEVTAWLTTGATTVSDDTWHFISLTKSGVNIVIKIDVVDALVSAASGALTSHTSSRQVGRNAGNTGMIFSFTLVRLFNYVLSDVDIYAHFQAERRFFGV